MESPDLQFWNGLEGRTANGYPLKTLLAAGDSQATYATECGQDARPATIKLIDANRGSPRTQLARWATISNLSHPNLLPVLDYGECSIDDVPMLYVVMEWAEDNLAGVLAGRPLSPSETKDMLEPIVAAIGQLHEQGLVHAAIQPSNILANGDLLKLSSDSITPVGDFNAGHKSSVYGPPEANPGIAGCAGDVWSLGMTLVQALTRQVPGSEAQETAHQHLPDPFFEVVRHCLRLDPDERWSVAQIGARLREPSPARAMAAPVKTAAIEGKPRPKWLVPAGAVAILASVALFALFAPLHDRTPSASESRRTPLPKQAPQASIAPPVGKKPAAKSNPKPITTPVTSPVIQAPSFKRPLTSRSRQRLTRHARAAMHGLWSPPRTAAATMPKPESKPSKQSGPTSTRRFTQTRTLRFTL